MLSKPALPSPASPSVVASMACALRSLSDEKRLAARERVAAYYQLLHPKYVQYLESLSIEALAASDRHATAAVSRKTED